MNTSNNESDSIIGENISHISPASMLTNTSTSSNTLITNSPRRSTRISSKSPQISSRTTNQLNIHRTLSGGVANSHSPKLNNRSRNSGGSARSDYSANASQIDLSNNINININHGNNYTTILDTDLPSDQSEDDEVAGNNDTVTQPKTTRLASRTEVLSHFEQQTGGYKCKICSKVYRASKFSDTNLRKHLSSSTHKMPNVLFKSQINDVSNIHVSPLPTERKRELHNAAINCIIQDGLPFNTFRRPGMSQLLSTMVPGYKGPHRRTVRRRIAAAYSAYTLKLRSILPKVGPLALTSDLWRNSRHTHFISLTAHVCSHNYETIPVVLGCRRILGPHLASSIERYINYELARLNIKKDQIISITTDNGSNMIKATSSFQFGHRISCFAHNLNSVVKKGLCLWNEPKSDDVQFRSNFNMDEWEDVDEDSTDDTNESYEDTEDAASILVSEEEEEDNSSIDEDGTDVDATINGKSDDESDVNITFSSLTLIDDYSSPINHFELLRSVFELMKKTRLIIKFIRNHNATNAYINKYIHLKNQNNIMNDKKTGNLVLDMIIRWSSTFLLLDRITIHKDGVNSMFAFPNSIDGLNEKDKKRLQELTLNQSEWELLTVLKDVLEPFAEATTVLSGQSYPTMACSLYVHRQLSHYFERKTGNDQPIIFALKQVLKYWFNIYCEEKLPAGQMDFMMIAAFLDPIIYNLLDENDRKSAKKIIFRKLNNSTAQRTTASSLSTTTSIKTKLNPLQRLAAICGQTSSTTTQSTMTLDEEISFYIKLAKPADNFQQFWTENGKQLPRLASLVRRVNIIPATSISSEALFSVASYLHRKQRSSLSSQTLRYLLVLKSRHVIDKLEQNYA